jgi:hypothetical protein
VGDDDAKREAIRTLLTRGLTTETRPRADDDAIFREIVDRLRASDGRLATKLVIGGFTLEMVEHEGLEQACESCMYYLVHRKYCELPELDLPVEPEWSCRLWRI